MPLNFWCWNIQRINLAKVTAFAAEIRSLVGRRRRARREALVGPDDATRFSRNANLAEVGVILENQTNPDAVCAALKTAFNTKGDGGTLSSPYTFVHRPMGGVAGTHENLIIAYRNCPPPNFMMMPLGDLVLRGIVADFADEQHLPARLSLRARGFGAGTALGAAGIADIARDEAEEFFNALLRDDNWYRGLAILRVAAGGKFFTVGTVHLPGPSAHARYSQGVNRRIVSEFVVPRMVQGVHGAMVDVVMGDFNIHGPADIGNNIVDLTARCIQSGTTITETFDPMTGFMSRHQFDKCLVNAHTIDLRTLDPTSLALIAPGRSSERIQTFREVTDHAGLFLFLP